ncbi:hypothetical protein AKJ41_05575 [candidate division MSBL1 archaeon SCGC-AAA259O05]|uniref:Uncharacterized protein n=1 Tax=candidate division MSBL1 archaeon SCGC-AAA259O05 TaxID=1698271 RepID=A0A133UYU1_9EURY|nr:hypothetical protein AKJ41_05575 [candidate division MSBL1 archaeon SCGC-AAA259O05]
MALPGKTWDGVKVIFSVISHWYIRIGLDWGYVGDMLIILRYMLGRRISFLICLRWDMLIILRRLFFVKI